MRFETWVCYCAVARVSGGKFDLIGAVGGFGTSGIPLESVGPLYSQLLYCVRLDHCPKNCNI